MINDLLGNTRQTNAPLYATLQAIKTAFIKRFQFDSFPMIFNDDTKGSVKKDRNIRSSVYPYQYWKPNTLTISKERGNIKTMREHGTMLAGATSNTTFAIGYMFPCKLDCTLRYTTNNVQEQFAFMERYLILVASESLNVKVSIPVGQDEFEFTVRIYIDDSSIQFPETQLEDESSPGNFSNEVSFSVDGFIGTHKNVPKFNNEGIISLGIDSSGTKEQQGVNNGEISFEVDPLPE